MTIFRYGIDTMTVQIAIDILHGAMKGELTQEAVDKINKSRRNVEIMANGTKPVYGVNTGFGPLCDTQITPKETCLLQKNLLLTHAVGVGEPIDPLLSRLMMIFKVHALSQGFSGVRLEVIRRIIYFIDNHITPVVPEQGSVGASGDLAPLSHLFLPLLGEGEVWINDEVVSAIAIYEDAPIEPMELSAKEGLGLINGTQFILAHAVMGLYRMEYLLDLADVSGAMSLEGLMGSASPFREELHNIRPFRGNKRVAERIRYLLTDSENVKVHEHCQRVQDPYSIRCIPQVHGASRNAFYHLRELAQIEMNSVTDNPIVLSEDLAVSGGSFHGQPLALALDYATLAAAELGNIADRRCYLLLEGKYDLPRLLTKHGGLNSGFMIPQYTTAALVTENKTLCFPASADSIPTSLGQEDHVSMGSISGRKFNQVLGNLEKIFAIEIMYAAQAMEFRRPNKFSPVIEGNFAIVREKVDRLDDDRLIKEDIQEMIKLVKDRAFIVR